MHCCHLMYNTMYDNYWVDNTLLYSNFSSLQKKKPTKAPWNLDHTNTSKVILWIYRTTNFGHNSVVKKICVSWTFSNISVRPIKYIKACNFSDFNFFFFYSFLGFGQRHLTHALILNYGLSKKHKLMHFSPGLLWALWKLNPSFYMTPSLRYGILLFFFFSFFLIR